MSQKITSQKRENPIQECHTISRSEYTDQRIASKISLPTPLGIPFEIWLNQYGNVIGCLYYRESDPEDEK